MPALPRPIPQLTPAEVDRFWANVDRSGGPEACWLYGLQSTSHPLIYYRAYSVRGEGYPAHRVAYALTKGPIPEGLELDHTCDVKACVNPAHLEAVTHRENMIRGRERRQTWDIYVNWLWYAGSIEGLLSSQDIMRLIEEGAIRTRFWYGQLFINREDLEQEKGRAWDRREAKRKAAQLTRQTTPQP